MSRTAVTTTAVAVTAAATVKTTTTTTTVATIRLLLPGCLAIALAALVGCHREQREFDAPAAPSAGPAERATSVFPGGAPALRSGPLPAGDPARTDANAYQVAQGKRFFRWYNCNGCHASGGGGMGPPLMDEHWRYGHEPAEIYRTIVEGRPGGMPAFGGRIPDDQLWQIVAYVRSLSGQVRKDVAPSRGDSLAGAPPENERGQERLVDSRTPAPGRATERPVSPIASSPVLPASASASDAAQERR